MKRTVMQIFKVTMIMAALTAMLLLVLSFMLYKINMSEKLIAVGIVVIYVLVNLLGGFLVGKIKEKNKYKWGILVGLIYFISLTLVSTIITGEMYGNGMQAIWAMLSCIGGGMLGGMCA